MLSHFLRGPQGSEEPPFENLMYTNYIDLCISHTNFDEKSRILAILVNCQRMP